MIDVKPYLQKILSYIESNNYAGYDPYDALNSPLLQLLSYKNTYAKVAFTHFVRRCPINLRPMLGIKKGHNPKGLGLFLSGYAKLYAVEKKPEYLEKIDYLLSLVERLRSKGYSGNCWGYNFDWQSWTYLRPKGTPTIVCCSFIGHALLDCYEFTAKQKALDIAVSIKDFILNDLHRTWLKGTFCFSYTPIDKSVVHNANLLGASILIRLIKYCDEPNIEDAAIASLSYTMKHQLADGSWYYADTKMQKWTDSFHTGFNLQAIRYFLEEGYALEYEQAYERGVSYYAANFFLKDGTPKYYHDRLYPIDIHASAQAIVFFSRLGRKYKELSNRVLIWMLNNMYSGEGWFYYRKNKFYTNKITYMRWSQAWAFHALSEYMLANVEEKTNVSK